MAEGFFEKWGRYLFIWYGFVFTVLGAAIGLWLAKEHWWISILIVVAMFAASGFFAYEHHRQLKKTEENHHTEVVRLTNDKEKAERALSESEAKLNRFGYETLARMEQLIASSTRRAWLDTLIVEVQRLHRMIRFQENCPEPIDLRTFAWLGGHLFVIGKAPQAALTYLEVDDSFLLMRVGSAGLETPIAQLVVHQPPNVDKKSVSFRVVAALSEEMKHLQGLAQAREIQTPKGYTIRLPIDPENFRDVNLTDLANGLSLLIQLSTRN